MYNIKLGSHWRSYLQKKPETGTGYQIAEVRLSNERVIKRVVISDFRLLWNFPISIRESEINEIKVI